MMLVSRPCAYQGGVYYSDGKYLLESFQGEGGVCKRKRNTRHARGIVGEEMASSE